MEGRRSLPHSIPSWVDPASEVWFVTVCCRQRGRIQLTHEPTACALLESIIYRHERQIWYAHIFLLMPDHCHALLSFTNEQEIAKTVRDWKRWTARELQIDWQIDFFEHRLRGGAQFALKADYIAQNPVRGGLVAKADDWPFVWRARE